MSEVLGGSWPILAGMLLCLVGSGFFSSSETAVFCLGPADVRALERDRRTGAAHLRRLIEGRASLLVTILLGNLAINILYFNLGALLSVRFAQADATLAAAAMPVATLLGVVVLGEVIPKTLAVHAASRVALLAAVPLLWLQRVLAPPRIVLAWVADGLARLIMGARREEGEVTDAELERLLRLAAAEGHLGLEEGDWLTAVLDLSATEVRQVMVPRVALAAFRLDAGREDFLRLVREHRRNKLPVHHGTLDEIDGYLDVRDVLARPEEDLSRLVRPVTFLPENALLSQVAGQVLDRANRLFIVVDEYGGTEGLLTKEDLVEAVVGDLADEAEPTLAPLVHLGPGHYEVDAGLSIRSWQRLVGRGLDTLPVSTVGGLVLAQLGRLPRVGDVVSSGRLRFKVLSVRHRRPHRIEVRLAGTGEVR